MKNKFILDATNSIQIFGECILGYHNNEEEIRFGFMSFSESDLLELEALLQELKKQRK